MRGKNVFRSRALRASNRSDVSVAVTKSKLDYRLNVYVRCRIRRINQQFSTQYQKHKSVRELSRWGWEGGWGCEIYITAPEFHPGGTLHTRSLRAFRESIAIMGNVPRSFRKKVERV